MASDRKPKLAQQAIDISSDSSSSRDSDSDSDSSSSSSSDGEPTVSAGLPFRPGPPPAHTFFGSHPLGPPPIRLPSTAVWGPDGLVFMPCSLVTAKPSTTTPLPGPAHHHDSQGGDGNATGTKRKRVATPSSPGSSSDDESGSSSDNSKTRPAKRREPK